MRVDPNYVLNLAGSVSQSTYNEATLTQQLASGLRIARLSDDPVAASHASQLGSQLSLLDSFVTSSSSEQSQLQVTDSTLGDVVTQLTRAIALGTQAANSTQNASNQTALANEVSGIFNAVLSLANTSYLGQHLFSGSQGSTPPYTVNNLTSPATVTYNGDTKTQSVQTPAGQNIQVNLPGSSVFTAASSNVLASLSQLVTDIASGNSTAISADTGAVSAGLGTVSEQRAILGASLNQLLATSSYAQTQAANITVSQSTLISADTAAVATNLKNAELQHQALLSVIASVNQTNLFSYLK